MNEIILTSENELTLSTERNICELLRTLDELKKQETKIKADLIDEMKKRGLVKIDTEKLTITYIEETTRESLDAKKLKEENPDVYDEYCRIFLVKESIRIKVK